MPRSRCLVRMCGFAGMECGNGLLTLARWHLEPLSDCPVNITMRSSLPYCSPTAPLSLHGRPPAGKDSRRVALRKKSLHNHGWMPANGKRRTERRLRQKGNFIFLPQPLVVPFASAISSTIPSVVLCAGVARPARCLGETRESQVPTTSRWERRAGLVAIPSPRHHPATMRRRRRRTHRPRSPRVALTAS